MNNPILSHIQLAARLTDYLYDASLMSSNSAQALFDVLADALASRPDVVASVSEELDAIHTDFAAPNNDAKDTTGVRYSNEEVK